MEKAHVAGGHTSSLTKKTPIGETEKMKLLKILKLNKLDWYIIKKFLGTYFFMLALIIVVIVVFDYNENIDKFVTSNAKMSEIIFDYYVNLAPYYANTFSALFVFISVIYFTSKLAENSEIIAILAYLRHSLL